jgi:hypothetical protein
MKHFLLRTAEESEQAQDAVKAWRLKKSTQAQQEYLGRLQATRTLRPMTVPVPDPRT